MQKTRMSTSAAKAAKVKKKLTKEQMQLTILKKKDCDAAALRIVTQLLEPEVDPVWLVENLKYINKCHMEDVIEERAITKLCGYVLCQKPITVVMKQRYQISLKDKKVYDISKRKNFCSPGCFGASNFLLEQMLTSPLWMRDNEEIPKFRILTPSSLTSHGEVVDITITNPCTKDDIENLKETEDDKEEKKPSSDDTIHNMEQMIERTSHESKKGEISENIEDFVLETIKNMNIEKADMKESFDAQFVANKVKQDEKIKPNDVNSSTKVKLEDALSRNKLKDVNVETIIAESKVLEGTKSTDEMIQHKNQESDIIEQHSYFVETPKSQRNSKLNIEQEHVNKKDSINTIKPEILLHWEKTSSIDASKDVKSLKHGKNDNEIEKNRTKQLESSELQTQEIDKKFEKSKIIKKKRSEQKVDPVLNLAAKIEQNFKEWITEDTINFLFGDDSVKQKTIEKIDKQDRYKILCDKLDKLQFQDEQEDVKILEKPKLKPAPHFAFLQEEGEKLDLKVRAFYQGKTVIEEPKAPLSTEENDDTDTFLPLTDVHASKTLRQKIVLEKLDQVLPDLLRTLAGNSEVSVKASLNYTSFRCTAVKALIQTFKLSAKNIIFKTAEWTLVSLIIIKMLSLLDPWLARLLLIRRAYLSMILASYKLDPNYLDLLVASYNPNINLR
ncbi:hypothetical protein TSAR_014761 [Trichomalopsis sarcophagae]|uniref:RNA polymerase II subunit B1 CTD phosphatase RPAP2 homolog n=1 Tax=Trichomalopsis sarcophagae TaxID=543379 RepID=A0A232FLK4_9HYME|nr:hypothetical protein TSAR_014761 [Trichomalopsis sarcophagae]